MSPNLLTCAVFTEAMIIKVLKPFSSGLLRIILSFSFASLSAAPQFYSFTAPPAPAEKEKAPAQEAPAKGNKDPFIPFKENPPPQNSNQAKPDQETSKAPLIIQSKSAPNLENQVLFQPGQTRKEEAPPAARPSEDQPIRINFNNVSMGEFLRFISKYSNRNFIFDEDELKFNVSIVSEEPTSINNMLTALYQVLRIHNLELIEQGNNMIIHKNPRVNSISSVVSESLQDLAAKNKTEIVTRVFRLNTLEPEKAASIIRPLSSEQSIIEAVINPNTLIVTDLVQNIEQVSRLIKSLDSPNSGLVVGQYAVRNMSVQNMQQLIQEVMAPLAQGQQLIFVPHHSVRSIFVISSPYLVERTLLMMKYIDQREGATQIHDLEKLRRETGGRKGKWTLDDNGNWVFIPETMELERILRENEEEVKKLIEKSLTKGEISREEAGNEAYLMSQLQKKHNFGELGRELTKNEALLSEKAERALLNGEVNRALTPHELDLLKKLQEELMHGTLNRELTPEEIMALKKLEQQYLHNELNRQLTPQELFFLDKIAAKYREQELKREVPPSGRWLIDDQGKWHFVPEGAPITGLHEPTSVGKETEFPEGLWELGPDGWQFRLMAGKKITARELGFHPERTEELPLGDIERTRFLIHKLQNRKGDEIVNALDNIAYSLQTCGRINEDLICALNSVQWIESSNSLIFTGYPTALEKVKELIYEIDIPARQVFIEMLILETTIDDSLTYGVNWASRFGGGLTAGSQAFLTVPSPLSRVMDTTGSNMFPNPNNLARSSGFNQGIVGESLSKNGVLFRSMGALVSAVHNRADTRVIMNPKILVEDNQEAEVFVGINTSFKTQSIANDQGQLLTNNFEFRDVGTTLRITPMISNNDMITLDIYQESSSVVSTTGGAGGGGGTSGGGGGTTTGGGGGGGGSNATANTENIGPTTRVNKTITRVHIPDGYFLVISGMMQDEDTINRAQVPCLGGVPVLGAFFQNRLHTDSKVNLMIFIRPKIVDTEEDVQHLTRHQQDIYRQQDSLKTSWKYGTEEALDFLNIPELCRPCCAEEFLPNE